MLCACVSARLHTQHRDRRYSSASCRGTGSIIICVVRSLLLFVFYSGCCRGRVILLDTQLWCCTWHDACRTDQLPNQNGKERSFEGAFRHSLTSLATKHAYELRTLYPISFFFFCRSRSAQHPQKTCGKPRHIHTCRRASVSQLFMLYGRSYATGPPFTTYCSLRGGNYSCLFSSEPPDMHVSRLPSSSISTLLRYYLYTSSIYGDVQ